jgi:RNA polymerase sigma-70 factor (ECF subfamily)
MASDEFEEIVAQHYGPLYKFAYSLTGTKADACDLTQHAFYVWATKGHQLRERSKIKSWLFTTLHRAFLETLRRQTRFPLHDPDEFALEDLPASFRASGNLIDSAQAVGALCQVDEVYRAAVSLFYLQDCSYKEIAQLLGIAEGTVKSRIARGVSQLRDLLGHTISARSSARREGRGAPGIEPERDRPEERVEGNLDQPCAN